MKSVKVWDQADFVSKVLKAAEQQAASKGDASDASGEDSNSGEDDTEDKVDDG